MHPHTTKTTRPEADPKREPVQAAGGGRYRSGLHSFSVVFVTTTFLLIALGGVVTSMGAGLSVPDWPTTFGYTMFSVPLDLWIGRGGVFWEHAHRLLGSLVGMMAIVMAVWLWRSQRDRPWVRWLGVSTLGLVIVQGVMGGFRVTEASSALAMVHGVTAQLVLCATVCIAAATGRLWTQATGPVPTGAGSAQLSHSLRAWAWGLLAVMLVQLVLGSAMRHTGSRLAIPDFPSAYGRWVPPLTATSIQAAINDRPYEQFTRYYTPTQVGVHYAHRLWAVVVVAVTVGLVTKVCVQSPGDRRLMRPVVGLVGMLLLQPALGVLVIWTGDHQVNNQIATAHQVTGAALLATVVLLIARLHALKTNAIGTRHGGAAVC